MTLDRFEIANDYAQRRLDERFHETEDALVAWGRWKRTDGPPNELSGVTTLARAITQQAEGASQKGAPNLLLLDFLVKVDHVMSEFNGVDAQLIRIRWVYHPNWAMESVRRKLGMSEGTYNRRIRKIRETVRTRLCLDGATC